MRYLFLLLLIILYPFEASGQSVQYTETINEWVFEKNYKNDDKTLDHCLIKNQYDNGTTFILAVNTDGIYRLALNFPHNNLVLEKSYSVDILVNDKKEITATAIVATPSVLAIGLPSDRSFIDKIGRGNTLTISGPKDMVQFALKGTAKAIKQLNTCVKETPQKKSNMPRLPKWLEHILLQINMTDIRTIEIDNNQNLPLDYAWITTDLFGGVKIMPYDKSKSSSDSIIKNYVNLIGNICSGENLSESSPSKQHNATTFIPYDIVCSTDDTDTITSLLFGVEDKSVTVFFFESDANGQSLSKRDALINVLTN